MTTIVVEHRERAARFGVEHVQAALSAQGRSIVMLDGTEVEDDLVRDMTEIITSFCARPYGRRSAERRAVAALSAAGEPGEPARLCRGSTTSSGPLASSTYVWRSTRG